MTVDHRFYLGRLWDAVQGKTLADQPILYDPADLTTHGVVTGMTGSGKTGLCVGLLEEAALQGIPAIMIDPKGDLTNLLLHFPNLAPQDFAPWIEAEAARRQGKTLDQLAFETAERWKSGLAEWGIQPERIAALQQAVRYTVYTPGSDAGVPVSILASLQVPNIPWEGNREVLRERISSTVTAILGLVGLTDIDPVRSREHILLSNIFEQAWSQGKSLELAELIMQTQTPPFTKLGVFPVDSFYPEKERFELAMLLNNFLASPAFQTWMEGQPLDIGALLFEKDGRPRHSIFYLAHLEESERMFFVTLLFSAVETWMRTQAGASGLRALLYFDEIVGYLPPISSPPSKAIMMRMLKQARAFGVGLLLATQNPVDVDYKALSNAGTWFIGKLQTEQDKQRLLDGLSSASGSLDRAEYDRLISGLNKRVFLMHNVHSQAPLLFQTRWAMNYLAGPLTRAQIPALNRLAGEPAHMDAAAGEPPSAQIPRSAPAVPAAVEDFQPVMLPAEEKPAPQPAVRPPLESSTTRPAVPSGVAEYFLSNNQSLNAALQGANLLLPPDAKNLGLIYRPALLAQAQVRYLARQYNVDFVQRRAVLLTNPDRRGMVRWDDFPYQAMDPNSLDQEPAQFGQPRFAALEAPLSNGKLVASLEKDFLDWIYRTSAVRLRANSTLKIYSAPDSSTADFRERTSQAARQAADAEIAKVTQAYEKKVAALSDKMNREHRELQQDEEELSQRKMEELGTHAENIFSMFSKSRRRVSTSLTKHRLTQEAKADVEESRQALAAFQAQLAELQAGMTREIQETNDRWAQVATETREITLNPQKKDVFVELFGVVWLPYYALQTQEKFIELPGFKF